MSTAVKILLIVLGIALALFLALVAAVALLVDPDDYRPWVVNAVESATGRSFEIEGELGLTFLPCCSVALGPASLGNPDGFPDDTFARVEQASASLELWPLIARQEVVVGSVILDGVNLELVRLADGRVNWELAAAEPPAATPEQEEESAPATVSVDAVILRDGRIHYRDEQAGQAFSITDLGVETGRIRYADGALAELPLEAALTVTDEGTDTSARVAADGRLAVAADGTLDLTGMSASVEAAEARLTATAAGTVGPPEGSLNGTFALEEVSPRALLRTLSEAAYRPADSSALTRLSAQGSWRFTGTGAFIDDLDVRLDESRLTGRAALEDLDSGAIAFELAVDRLNVDRYLPADEGSSAPASSPAQAAEPVVVPLDALTGIPIAGAFTVDALTASGVEMRDLALRLTSDGDTVAITAAVAGLGGGNLALEGGGNVSGGDPRLTGTLTVEGVSPRALLTAMGAAPETADPAVLDRLAGTARWILAPRSAALQDMRWQLDATTATGSLHVDNFDTLATRFDLALDRLDVDAYLPPESSEQPAPEEPAEIPADLVRGLTLEGQLRAGELVLMEMALSQVVAEVQAVDGVLRLDPLSARLYGGEYRGVVVVDATGSTTEVQLEQQLSAVQVSEVLQGLFDTDVLGGALSLSLSGSGTGNTTDALLQGLAADVSFDLSDGVYRGMDVLYELKRARALLKKEAAPAAPDSSETAIRTLTATGRMQDGVLQTRELSAETAALRLAGQGGIDLMELALDYRLDAHVLEAAAAAAGLGDLAGATIPLSIAGPLRSPKVSVDLKGLVTTTVRDAVQRRAVDQLMERLGGGQEEEASAPPGEATPGEPQPPAGEAQDEEPSGRDLLKRSLRDLLKPPRKDAEGDDAPP